jgi:hypothetical protein
VTQQAPGYPCGVPVPRVSAWIKGFGEEDGRGVGLFSDCLARAGESPQRQSPQQTEVAIFFGIEKGDRGQQEAAAPKSSVGEFFEKRLSVDH